MIRPGLASSSPSQHSCMCTSSLSGATRGERCTVQWKRSTVQFSWRVQYNGYKDIVYGETVLLASRRSGGTAPPARPSLAVQIRQPVSLHVAERGRGDGDGD